MPKRSPTAESLRDEVVEAIRASIRKYGREAGAKLAREQYPLVPRNTWYRWMKQAGASPQEMAIDAATEAAKHLPAAPPPTYYAERPAEASKNFDLLAKIHRLYWDAEKVREHSITLVKHEDGRVEEKIRVMGFFSDSIKHRANVLELMLKTHQQVWDIRRMAAFYDIVFRRIAEADPEVARRIAADLAELDANMGITIHGEPGATATV